MPVKIRVKYQGNRFPRTVSLRGGNKTSFHSHRLTLDLEEYDALALLKYNNRINPERWEFTIEKVLKEKVAPAPEEDSGVQVEEKGTETSIEGDSGGEKDSKEDKKNKKDKEKKDSPKEKGSKKGRGGNKK